jgi:hypothetical protein
MPTIMYCCDVCVEQYPEGCAREDREELRVTPEGTWLCEGCYSDTRAETAPCWGKLPVPPEYGPKEQAETVT